MEYSIWENHLANHFFLAHEWNCIQNIGRTCHINGGREKKAAWIDCSFKRNFAVAVFVQFLISACFVRCRHTDEA